MAPIDQVRWCGLTCRALARRDVPGASALSREAQWNQTPGDWQYMIASGRGWGLFDGRDLVATAVTLRQVHGAFGWISMVLVTGAWQRRGLATGLLDKCIQSLRDDGLTPGLDATEFGRPVYLPLGFQDVYPLTRLELKNSAPGPASSVPGSVPVDGDNFPSLLADDKVAAGCDRSQLLAHLCDRAPQLAWTREDGSGHCFGRDGIDASQIGPVVAADERAAIALVARALSHVQGPVFMDVPDHQRGLTDWLHAHGFSRQRSFVRMLHGRDRPFGDPDRTFAIAGPELG